MIDVGTFIAGTSVLAFLILGVIKKFIKEAIEPRFSDLVVQIVLVAIGAILALIGYLLSFIPKDIWNIAYQVLKDAIFIYQVLYKAIYQKAILGKVDPDEK
jgi:protein-S-isoprenylcysteine O-methyltransferase Ste14